jgi:peptidoglycan-associated lipoprotein
VSANGGTAAFTGYANRWLGVTGEFGAYRASPFGASANTYTFLAGPRVSYRHSERVAPFAQVLVGGAHLTAGASGISASASGFAWSAGGGIDLGLSRHLAFRPQFDYIGIRAGGGTLNTARASPNIVFRFGSR